jgi:hypothetical protein
MWEGWVEAMLTVPSACGVHWKRAGTVIPGSCRTCPGLSCQREIPPAPI